MIRRWQEDLLRQGLSDRRGVHLTGARQCGKSTLAEFVADGQMRHLTLDEAIYLKAAKDDPMTFVDRRDGRTLVIDEVQKAPELLNAIKVQGARDSTGARWCLTLRASFVAWKRQAPGHLKPKSRRLGLA